MSVPSASTHVWTGRAPRPSATQRIRAVVSAPTARVALGVATPALALSLLVASAGNGAADAADGVVVAAAPAGTSAAAVAGGRPAPVEAAAPVPAGPMRMAAVDGVNLFVTSPAASIVAFHEAAYPTALNLLPVGHGLAFDNGRVGHVEAAGPNYVVMGSRGRATGPASAIDIAQAPGTPVVSAVTGTVVDVQRYDLYGRYPDTRVEIAPAGRPDLRVVMLHVTDATVVPGQPVEAGVTQVARTATHFPFTSHVDRYAGGHPPHVHVEVKRV